MKEYYSILFLKDGSSLEEVKKAYRKLVKKFHPDKNQESNEYTEEFKLIQEAYEKLVSYLAQDQKEENVNTDYYSSSSKSQSGGLVKSDAKFAEAGEEILNHAIGNFIIGTLIVIFIFCGFYAITDINSLTFRIISLIILIPFTILFGYGLLKKASVSSSI